MSLATITQQVLEAAVASYAGSYTRPEWDEFFLLGALWVSLRGDCRRRRHGALIVQDRRVVAAGYNGAPAGQRGCLAGGCPRGLLAYEELASLSSYDDGPGKCYSIHAEANAIIHGEYERINDSTIYITGQPCFGCQKLIAGAGIARALWPGGEWDVTSGFPTSDPTP